MVYDNSKNLFYFIDKKGEKVEHLSNWEQADIFDLAGYAKTRANGINYLLDTLGNRYQMVSHLIDLNRKVEALKLEGTQSDALLDTILQHPQLKVLVLDSDGNNKEERKDTLGFSIPQQLDNLKDLKNLSIKSQNIETLPAEISQLQNLTYLDLSGNRLEDLPSTIGQLKNLTHLNLAGNKLRSLPSNIEQLQNLTYLNLNNNPLDSLSADFFNSDVAKIIDYKTWFKECGNNSRYKLAVLIRESIQDWTNFDTTDYSSFAQSLIKCDTRGAIWSGEQYVQSGGTNIKVLSVLVAGYFLRKKYDKSLTIYKENSEHKSLFLKDLEQATAQASATYFQDGKKVIDYLESSEPDHPPSDSMRIESLEPIVSDDTMSMILTQIAEELEIQKLAYDHTIGQNASGIYHKVKDMLQEELPKYGVKIEDYEFPLFNTIRSTRQIAYWYYELINLHIVQNALEDQQLIRPDSVLFFGRANEAYENLDIDKLSNPDVFRYDLTP